MSLKITVKELILKKHATYLNLYFLIDTLQRFRQYSYSCCFLKTPFSTNTFSPEYPSMAATSCNTETGCLV